MDEEIMTGEVKYLSRSGRRAAVITDYGYTVFDIAHGELSVGDTVTGFLDDHGDQDLTNRTTGHKLSVYIEAIQATQQNALDLLRYI